ncbi:protein timeless homolog isoform X2 [Mangifera indica]|uniref:protein timeless homolog isoform X2 n=1 Tax=Mangifera indica TaxID=29780 RepID=UPI001CFA0DF9|nr:protein timeless homolog isoform X2 [Mangifera indica]
MDMEGLSAICAGLGMVEEDEKGNRISYYKGEYCLDNLKDLLRFLRRDDPQTREVFKQVCKWNIATKDLIPIIEHCQDDRGLVLNAVKVLVFLTMPVEPSSNDIPQQIEYLWGLKSAITCSDTVPVIVSLLEGPLENLEREAFTEDDWKLVQLVLTLFRNVLAVQDIPLQQKAGSSTSRFISLRDGFLELLFNGNVMDIILMITPHVGGSNGYLQQDNLLLVEIFYYIFMGQDPESVACAHQKMGGVTKDPLESLKSLIAEEEEKRRLSRLHQKMVRHSQFSGMFTRLTMDGSKSVIKGNPTSASQNPVFKPHKGCKGASNKTVWDHGTLPSTKDNILRLLHDLVDQFLLGSYNVLMQSICEDIEKEHQSIQNSDIIIFFQVAQFVTSFQYHRIEFSKLNVGRDTFEASATECSKSTMFRDNICGPIASSMDESMFQLVISRWRNAFDALKETKNYKFLSAAGSLMKSMINMLDLVLKALPKDSKEAQTARILLYKLFYDQTDQGMTHFLLNLIRVFDIHKQPKSDLADLVEMIYVLVRLMENLQSRGVLRVSRKSRKGRKKEIAKGNKESGNKSTEDHGTIQNEDCISNGETLADCCMSEKENSTNATSAAKEDMRFPAKIDRPEMLMSDIQNPEVGLLQKNNRGSDHTDDYLCCSTGDSSDGEQPVETNEVDFKISTFLSAFVNCNIIQKLCWLLKFYKSNSNRTNHYIICMMRRITDDLALSPMLYQLSFLTIFYDILAEQRASPDKDHANIVDFLTRLIRKMLKRMKKQPLLFVEILFWKTRKDCHCIDADYLLDELGNIKKKIGKWQNGLEVGYNGSTQANGMVRRSIADALGDDEADVVISHELGNGGNFVEGEEGMASFIVSEVDKKGNSENSEIFMQEQSGKVSKKKRSLSLSDEWDTKFTELYEKFKDDQNCSHLIAESLNADGKVSAAQISNKLKQLGFKVPSKKRVRHTGEPFAAGPDEPQEGQNAIETENDVHNSNELEGSLTRQSLSNRKRIRAFNSDQEAMIKVLFERYKDHKRCSYMIANALDGEKRFTTAQVSRKLKQLGLLPPQQKRSEAQMHLRDEELNDSSLVEAHDSDEETLLSLKNRHKSNDGGSRLFGKGPQGKDVQGKPSDASDDETLSSVFKRKSNDGGSRLFGEGSQEKDMQGILSDDSDDETLGFVFKKSRKLHSKPKDDRLETTQTERTNEDVRNSGRKGDTRRDGCNQSGEIDFVETNQDISIKHANQEGTSVSETNGSHISSFSPVTVSNADDELADSDDDVAASEMQSNAVSRRKLRMVIDLEDDD